MKNAFCSSRFSQLVLGSLLCLCTSLAAETLTGTVMNKTTNKLSAGDDVILLKLAQGMQEAGRTKTDAHGHFSFNMENDGAHHVLRVSHDKSDYFEPVPQGTHEVQVTVYDAAPKVTGVTAAVYAFRMQTDPAQGLQVIQGMELKNDSTPPRTQMSENGFDVYLPENAEVDSARAVGSSGMPVNVTARPLDGKGHYGVMFPIRPGQTEIEVVYHLPYSGSAAFTPRLTLPADTVVIQLPKSMKVDSNVFHDKTEEAGTQVYITRSVLPDQSLAFTVSGTGTLPEANADNGQAPDNGAAQANAAPAGNGRVENRPGGGMATPEDTPDPLQKYRWWILGVFALLLGGGAYILVTTNRDSAALTPAVASGIASNNPISALKDELFRLETDKLQGHISDAEYTQTKAALDVVLRRALGKSATSKGPAA